MLETAIGVVQTAIAALEPPLVSIDGVQELVDLLEAILTSTINLLNSPETLVSADVNIEQQCSIAASVCVNTQNLVTLIDNLVKDLIDVLTTTVEPLVDFLINTLKPALQELNTTSCVSVDVE